MYQPAIKGSIDQSPGGRKTVDIRATELQNPRGHKSIAKRKDVLCVLCDPAVRFFEDLPLQPEDGGQNQTYRAAELQNPRGRKTEDGRRRTEIRGPWSVASEQGQDPLTISH